MDSKDMVGHDPAPYPHFSTTVFVLNIHLLETRLDALQFTDYTFNPGS
jgi:hypothetical protein